MRATTRRSAARTRRRRCSATLGTARTINRSSTCRPSPGSAGRRLCRLLAALRVRPPAGTRDRSALLEPWPTQVLPARRHRGQQEARQARTADLAAGAGGGEADRRAARYRACDQRRAENTESVNNPAGECGRRAAPPTHTRGLAQSG